MKYIYYKDDFKVTLEFKDGDTPTPLDNVDFRGKLYTAYDKYSEGIPFSRIKGDVIGCDIGADGSLTIVADNHGFRAGKLMVDMKYYIYNDEYADGTQTIARTYDLKTWLTTSQKLADGDRPIEVNAIINLPLEVIVQQVKDLTEKGEQIVADAGTAIANVNTAIERANTATESVEGAVESANTAANKANTAANNVNTAIESANSAAQRANTAADSVTAVIESANTATSNANSAAEEARSAASEANAATATATAAAEAATNAATNANTAADEASQYADRYEDIANSLPIVTPDFEGAEYDKGLRYVVRKNKLIAILKDGHVEYAPEGIAFVDAIEPTSFTIGATTYNVPAGVSYVELGLNTAQNSLQQVFYKATLRSVHFVLDTSKVTNFHDFFAFCSNLETVDLSSIDTSSATQLYHFFYECSKLKEIDLSGFSTSECFSFGNMFWGCKSLQSLDVSSFDTSKATTLAGMFANLQISEIDVSNFRTENVINLSYMFSGCANLLTLDLSSFQTPINKRLDMILNGCTNLKFVDVSSLDTSQVISFKQTFWGCKSLQQLDLSSFELGAATEVNGMFVNDIALTSLKFPNMGQLKADKDYNKVIDLSYSPLDKASLDSIFTYDRTANGLTNTLTVQLSAASKALLTAEEIAAITAKGYTIA